MALKGRHNNADERFSAASGFKATVLALPDYHYMTTIIITRPVAQWTCTRITVTATTTDPHQTWKVKYHFGYLIVIPSLSLAYGIFI